MTDIDDDTSNEPARSGPGRRALLGGLALGGAAVVGGVTGAAASGGSSELRRETLTFEVACLGELWREGSKANAADDGDFRAPFLVEGWIYPVGTIPGDGFVPTEDGAIGRWFCRGYVAIDARRAEPHTASHQDYVLGPVTEEAPFVPTLLSSCGLEGTFNRSLLNPRAIIGGTGDYMGASGQVIQQYVSDNTSPFADGTNAPSPNFSFEFDLLLPT